MFMLTKLAPTTPTQQTPTYSFKDVFSQSSPRERISQPVLLYTQNRSQTQLFSFSFLVCPWMNDPAGCPGAYFLPVHTLANSRLYPFGTYTEKVLKSLLNTIPLVCFSCILRTCSFVIFFFPDISVWVGEVGEKSVWSISDLDPEVMDTNSTSSQIIHLIMPSVSFQRSTLSPAWSRQSVLPLKS